MTTTLPTAIAALAALAALVPASAAGATRPTDDSSIDQYLPSVPVAGGDQTVGGNHGRGGNGSSSGTGSSLPPSTAAALQADGAAGAAVASLVYETGPEGAQAGADHPRTSGGSPQSDGSHGPGAVGQLASKSLDGEGGMGALFPLILAATLSVAVAALILRRRDDNADAG